MVRRVAAFAVAMALAAPGAALASGPGVIGPWYVDPFGGGAADLQRVYDGRLGIVMARASKPQLYMAWRLLHGQRVGREAGAALSIPCCDASADWRYAPEMGETGMHAWLDARKLVPLAPELERIDTERAGPDYTSIPTCFEEAFTTAAATLKDRVAKYGATSGDVTLWLQTQDAVFEACGRPGVTLPLLSAGPPAWLKADRAYQEAAFALYDGRHDEAADRFAAIGKDKASPWRPMGPYLRARSLVRGALANRTPEAFAKARAAIADLSKLPEKTYGRGEVRDMLRILAYRDRPAQLLAELDRELAGREPPADIAVAFRDYANLADKAAERPQPMAWIATLRAAPDTDALSKAETEGGVTDLYRRTRASALAQAQARWEASRDVAWLVAALSLVDPGAPEAAGLAAAAAKVGAGDPAWLTAQYHLTRLTLRSAPAAETRARLDAILARTDLSVSDRNILTAQRMQVAADPGEFARFSLRQRLCRGEQEDGCTRGFWHASDSQPYGVYDRTGYEGARGFGEDARAIIDRLPLKDRIALGRDARLPAAMRLDVALTNYGRAVVLGDHAAVDALAADLEVLLPQLAPEWRKIRATPVGLEKRFVEFFVLAKVPGVRTDLVDYNRPEGAVAQFRDPWTNWIVLPKGKPVKPEPPALALYQQAGAGVDSDGPDAATDLACLGECGQGASPLRLPDFAAAGAAQATIERGYFVRPRYSYGEEPPPLPPGGVAAWDEMLAFAKANPKHPMVPEALYWIIRAGRWGGSHNHSGKRAFELLHAAYPASAWAKRSPYYYD